MTHIQADTVSEMIQDASYRTAKQKKIIMQKCTIPQYIKRTSRASRSEVRISDDEAATHADICGPFQQQNRRGNKYSLTMVTASHRSNNMKTLKLGAEFNEHHFIQVA